MARKIWTKEETELFHQIYHLYTRQELAEMFDCEPRQIYTKFDTEGIVRRQYIDDVPEGMKRCTECHDCLPLDCFYSAKKGTNHLQSICISCSAKLRSIAYKKREEKKYEKEKEEYIKSFEGKVLTCPKCGDQSIHEYKVYKESRSGKMRRRCKKCSLEASKKSKEEQIKKNGYI